MAVGQKGGVEYKIMARYTEAKCRLCRLEGTKLFLKGARCEGQMCAFSRRQTPPGQHGAKRARKRSEYGIQLREKQKVKHLYGVLEAQFRNAYQKALRYRGNTGEMLLSLLERRLDNACYLLGWGLSKGHARKLVGQGKVLVNGRAVRVPSFSLKKGDKLGFKGLEKDLRGITKSPEWLKTAKKGGLTAEVVRLPERADIASDIEEQLIVEFYSR